ncbi:galactokinase [Actinotalea ferrariae]|uniref:galactokinase n=1 Tax=Actinotalea ferrariae TaxID=1386098 RepID=UPI001C8BAA72|nr:galactokinase [Actinotalea ferrariae]MBX9244001.1 galactokinase [Actinotalea ferrariae]
MTETSWVAAWAPADGTARVTAAFAEHFGGAPDGVWSAPGRINVIGEHTDYNGGLCMPAALPHRTYVALRTRSADDGLPRSAVRLASAQEAGGDVVTVDLADVGPGRPGGWTAYVVGVAWALREAGHDVAGFDAVVDSCVPYGAGLSSSAALECSVAVALDEVHGLGLGDDAGRAVLAEACIRAENGVAGAATGGMDQAASLRCREGHALLLDCRDGSTRHIPLDLESHGLALLVIDTRAEHQLADGQYASRRAACERAAAHLGVATLREVTELDAALAALATLPDAEVVGRRVRHVVTDNARVREVERLLDAGDVEAVGPVLTAAHASLRDDYEVSCRELDVAVDAATAAGALGGRMIGGGFGGSAIALVLRDDVDAVAGAVAGAFAREGLAEPRFLVATAAGPAGRS